MQHVLINNGKVVVKHEIVGTYTSSSRKRFDGTYLVRDIRMRPSDPDVVCKDFDALADHFLAVQWRKVMGANALKDCESRTIVKNKTARKRWAKH
jgi:hypothetical protein